MKKKSWFASCVLLSMVCAGGSPVSAVNVSGSTVQLLLHHQQMTAQVNGSEAPLDVPAEIVDGSFYIPLRWAGDKLGFPVQWNDERRTVGMTTSLAYLEWDLARGSASANGVSYPLNDTAIQREGSLLVKLSWIAAYLEIDYRYYSNPSRVEITYVQKTEAPYRESAYPEDMQPNSRPMAVFMTDKEMYRIGEPIQYIDLSYDPDAEGLPHYEWTGKQEAFFEPGTHTVSLRVSDGHGNWSLPFSKSITVNEETFLSASEFPWHTKPTGSFIRDDSADWLHRIHMAPKPVMSAVASSDRKLMVSGASHTIRQTGVVFRQQLEGKARLVSDHINAMEKKAEVHAVVRNPSEKETIAVRVTRQGMAGPTLFHRYVGVQAATDYVAVDASDRTVTVKPGQSEVLERYVLEPGQGFTSLADIETTGKAEIGIVVTGLGQALTPLELYESTKVKEETKPSPANILLDMDASAQAISGLAVWTTDNAVATVYSMKLNHPRQGAIAMRAQDGYAVGALKVNGHMQPLPPGGMTDEDGALLIYRCDGTAHDVTIEWMPTPGSHAPIDWIFYPLEDRH